MQRCDNSLISAPENPSMLRALQSCRSYGDVVGQVLDKMLKRHSLVTIPFDNAHRLYHTDVDAALFDDDGSDTAEDCGAHSDPVDRSTDDGRGHEGLGRLDSTRAEDASGATVMQSTSINPLHSHVMS